VTIKKKLFDICVLGCRVNQYEIQAMTTQLESLGYTRAQEGEVADLCIVNTCAVTEHAESSSRHAIRSLMAKHKGAKVVVTGCLAERVPTLAREIPGIEAVIGNSSKESLVDTLFPENSVGPFSISRFDGHTRAFVKVQDGCNSFCSYCIVPYLRGRSRSRDPKAILDEILTLIDSGYKEVVLTGVNLGDFELPGYSLAKLVRDIDQIPGLHRLRLSSINPNEITDDLIEAIVSGKSTCHSLHLVLQSGSDAVLQRMRRRYTRSDFLEIVRRFRQHDAKFMFTTDAIVGFPGEREEDFQDTLGVIDTVGFLKVHMFPYSERPGTSAVSLDGKVPEAIIKGRKTRLLQLAESVSYNIRNEFLGQRVVVLTEGEGHEGLTIHGLPVLVPEGACPPNSLLSVTLLENTTTHLIGAL
jgi:threonylcarbamoyladenosine tRNA methylthiotransferase MtaB